MCAVCKLHGVRLIKGIKIFKCTFMQKTTQLNSEQLLLLDMVIGIFEQNCRLSFIYFGICKFQVYRQIGSLPVCI